MKIKKVLYFLAFTIIIFQEGYCAEAEKKEKDYIQLTDIVHPELDAKQIFEIFEKQKQIRYRTFNAITDDINFEGIHKELEEKLNQRKKILSEIKIPNLPREFKASTLKKLRLGTLAVANVTFVLEKESKRNFVSMTLDPLFKNRGSYQHSKNLSHISVIPKEKTPFKESKGFYIYFVDSFGEEIAVSMFKSLLHPEEFKEIFDRYFPVYLERSRISMYKILTDKIKEFENSSPDNKVKIKDQIFADLGHAEMAAIMYTTQKMENLKETALKKSPGFKKEDIREAYISISSSQSMCGTCHRNIFLHSLKPRSPAIIHKTYLVSSLNPYESREVNKRDFDIRDAPDYNIDSTGSLYVKMNSRELKEISKK